MGFLQPAFQFREYRQAFFLSNAKALVIAGFFEEDYFVDRTLDNLTFSDVWCRTLIRPMELQRLVLIRSQLAHSQHLPVHPRH
jgi:hypothetical protein